MMTDRRVAATFLAPRGLSNAVGCRWPRAVVVGGGIAGLAAATGLAERGVAVEVVEREPYLGGRVGGWTEHTRRRDARDEPRVPRLLPAVLQPARTAPARRSAPAHADARRGLSARRRRRPARQASADCPHPAVERAGIRVAQPDIPAARLARIDARAAAPLAAVSVPEIYRRLDHIDAETFLREIKFPEAARHLAFEVFSRSFFADPAQLSAAELATMFHIYFLGSSEGLIFDVANANYDAALWQPLRSYLEGRGVRLTGSAQRGECRRAGEGFPGAY